MKKTRGMFEKIPGSGVWWIRFTDAEGEYRREKCGSWATAAKLLKKRNGDAVEGRKLGSLRQRTVTFGEIADDALEYSRQHKRSYKDDQSRMKRLKEWFGNRAAESLTVGEIEKRLSDTAAEEEWA
jgi:hypothetical protein